jgi:hypothetical protein
VIQPIERPRTRLENYVSVTGDDHARLAERADELVRFDDNRAPPRLVQQ